ncbi:MAG: DUF58 domain-containing protein [Betaproteobacteria bacterium]|nr:DUF58 domain-containing protein [Betaproteobacteria bacterium]
MNKRWRLNLQERIERWMLRVRPPEALPITLPQRRVYVLPTGVGLSFGALLIAMLLTSLNYTLSLGFALTFILVGVGHLALLGAHRNLLGMSLMDGRVDAVFSGEPVALQLYFADTTGRARNAIELVPHDGEAQRFDIPPNGRTCATVFLPPLPRGRYRAGRIKIETRYPLGLIRAWSYLEPDISFWIYPKPELHPPPHLSVTGGQQGRKSSVPGSESFDSLRPYRPGDPLRRIAWTRLARGGPLVTKEFRSEAGKMRMLRWDDCSGLEMEARLSRLCAWMLAAHQNGEPWGLALPGKTLPLGEGTAHLRKGLETLAALGANRD